MSTLTIPVSRATAYGLLASGLLVYSVFLPLSTPDAYFIALYGGVALATGLSLFFYRRERRLGLIRRPVGIVVMFIVICLFLLLSILPAIVP